MLQPPDCSLEAIYINYIVLIDWLLSQHAGGFCMFGPWFPAQQVAHAWIAVADSFLLRIINVWDGGIIVMVIMDDI